MNTKTKKEIMQKNDIIVVKRFIDKETCFKVLHNSYML